MGLEEHWVGECVDGCGDGWIETFEMTDGDDAVVSVGEFEHAVCFGERCGERFFNKQVEAER